MKNKFLILIFPVLIKNYSRLSLFIKTKKLLESVLSLILILYVLAYTFPPYTNPLDVCAQDYFKNAHVVISCDDVQAKSVRNLAIYNFLSASFNDDELGMTGITNKIFINNYAINKFELKESNVFTHELEHINQRETLGFFNFFFITPAWVLEGGAEYYRGKPTLDICDAFKTWGESSKQQFYFESWVKAYYLLEVKKVSYIDFLFIKSDSEYEVNKNLVFNVFCKNNNFENY